MEALERQARGFHREQSAALSPAARRLRERLAEAQEEQRRCIYQRRDMAAAARLQPKISRLQESLAALEKCMPKPLSQCVSRQELDRMGISEKIVLTFLAADFFNDAVSTLREALAKLGLEGCSLFPLAKEIERKSAEYAALACGDSLGGLGDMMCSDAKLVRDLTAICQAWFREQTKG